MKTYPDKDGRIMSPESQLDLWIEDKLVHNGIDKTKGECLPDFSCCVGNPWPIELRKQFKNASEDDRMQMLVNGLSKVINTITDEKVYVAGTTVINN